MVPSSAWKILLPSQGGCATRPLGKVSCPSPWLSSLRKTYGKKTHPSSSISRVLQDHRERRAEQDPLSKLRACKKGGNRALTHGQSHYPLYLWGREHLNPLFKSTKDGPKGPQRKSSAGEIPHHHPAEQRLLLSPLLPCLLPSPGASV